MDNEQSVDYLEALKNLPSLLELRDALIERRDDREMNRAKRTSLRGATIALSLRACNHFYAF